MLNELLVRRVAAAVAAIATALTWVSVGPFSVTGLDTSGGKEVAVLAVLAFGATFLPGRWTAVSALPALGVMADCIYDWHLISERATTVFGSFSPGIGLIVSLLAGAVVFVLSIPRLGSEAVVEEVS